MSHYDTYRNPPVTYLVRAEKALLSIDPGLLTNDTDTIAYAQALINLASAQMTGSFRR